MSHKVDETAMKPETKRELKPKLRFPEFQNAPEWEEKTLGKLADVAASGDLNAEYFSPIPSTQHTYPVYSNSVEQEGLYGYYSIPKYPKHSITITARGTLGVAFMRRQDFMGIGRLIVVSNLKDANTYFLMECWNHLATIPQEVTSIPQLTAIAAKATVLPVPHPSEQQKIADCLYSIDEVIAAQGQKLDALKVHKKGLLQQLFPAAGETVPQLRFPEFQDAPEWVNRSLGEISTITSGGTPSRSKKEFWNGNIPWVTTTLIDFNTIYDTDEYISKFGLKGSSAKLFPKNTILMAMYGQGKTRGKVAILGIEATTNQACAAIILNKGFHTNFVFQYLASRYDEIRELSNRGGQANLSAGLIETIPISYPTHVNEQQKISDFLSSLDELITAQTQKLAALKAHKKGLLQQLFPVPDEVQE